MTQRRSIQSLEITIKVEVQEEIVTELKLYVKEEGAKSREQNMKI